MREHSIRLRPLQAEETPEIRVMIQEIGPGENGFVNGLYTDTEEDYQAKLAENARIAIGDHLPPGYVRQRIYWLYDGEHPVGYGKLRFSLTDALREHGGHIGYVIRPSARGKGYGRQMLKELLLEAEKGGLDRVLLTCNAENAASRSIIEGCGGKPEQSATASCKYWIELR
ncbi:GNAT family N-acetyltransferase [Saccharibacillus sacchari]|uniref:GNAT family N-acetyltransferase n=1 Tax=Saccharibacillus sacchari TaxID=456493 RepID=UPI0004B0DC97|nr:GNAT family N-acetyltransferase [Saccharibacillus sacchari]